MLPPFPPTRATLQRGERHLHSARARVCGWEKSPWPFHGYTPSDVNGSFPANAHWTNRRLIIEPKKNSKLETLLFHSLTKLVEHANYMAGAAQSRKLEATEKLIEEMNEQGAYLSVPHTEVDTYQQFGSYVQVVLLESTSLDNETLCFSAWERDTAWPRNEEIWETRDKIVPLANKLVAQAARQRSPQSKRERAEILFRRGNWRVRAGSDGTPWASALDAMVAILQRDESVLHVAGFHNTGLRPVASTLITLTNKRLIVQLYPQDNPEPLPLDRIAGVNCFRDILFQNKFRLTMASGVNLDMYLERDIAVLLEDAIKSTAPRLMKAHT